MKGDPTPTPERSREDKAEGGLVAECDFRFTTHNANYLQVDGSTASADGLMKKKQKEDGWVGEAVGAEDHHTRNEEGKRAVLSFTACNGKPTTPYTSCSSMCARWLLQKLARKKRTEMRFKLDSQADALAGLRDGSEVGGLGHNP